MAKTAKIAPVKLNATEGNVAPGSVVQIKSGGPKMTVEGVADNLVLCVWHTDNGALAVHRFMPTTLNVVG